MVFHGVSGKDSVTIVSESEYVAQKDVVSEAIKSRPQQDQPPKLMTTKEMDYAMGINSDVRTLLRRMKLQRCAND